ncbi:hypothetical protein AgCh_034510 [Apium graveolens]
MLRHLADGVAWKIMDAKYPTFSSKNRNIRLGIASDGFNPFGPTDPENSIDVYLQPLVEELKELWDVGVTTFDAAMNQNFVLRASVLWTISDFPGYTILSGWSTKGYLACPICNYETSSTYLKHGRKVEVGQAPVVLSGRMIKRLLDGYQNTFGDSEISLVNELGTRIHETSGYPILSGRNQKGKAYQLPDDVWTAAHRYILFNYDDKEVEALIEQHRSLFDVNAKLNKYKRARTHTDEVCEWFKTEIGKKLKVSREIASLAIGPKRVARWFRGYVVNGYRMEGDFMTFNLHHKGEFHKNKYAGGTVNTVKDFELDAFSYSELMEWVNQLSYKEIGGIYVQKEENSDGWELITDKAALNEYTFKSEASELELFIDCDVDKNVPAMRQMQPHVIVRPKRSPVNPKKDNPKKRQFVTLKDINEEKTRKMNKSRKKTQSTDKVSKAVAIERKSDQSDLMGMAKYMKRFEIPDTNKNLGEGAREGPDGGNAPNIQSDEDESQYRCPEKDLDRESNEEEHIVKPKGKIKAEKVVVKTDGPKTRSRTSKMSLLCDKPVNTVEPKENDASEVPIVLVVEKLKQLKNRGPGTMERYLELREREKEAETEAQLEAEMEGQIESLHDIFQSQQAQADAPAEKIKKPQGKSKMKHVHTRGEKREIVLSKLVQPISDDDLLLSEFSNFLGTTDKYIIFEEGYKYVMTTMRDQFRGYKASIKKDHYSKYDTNQLSLQNRPRQVPLKDFKILLKYWGDEKVQERARKNAVARNKITETHTVGPRSFAQVCHKMAIERERLDKPDEPIIPISDADVYVKTRKRDAKREYKLPTDVVEKKIEDVRKNLKDGNIDTANEVVRAGKEHSRSYLVGRFIRKKESNGNSPTRASDQYLASLTENIRDELKQEEFIRNKPREVLGIGCGKLGAERSKIRSRIQNFLEGAWAPTQDAGAAAWELGRPLRNLGRPLRDENFNTEFYNPYSDELLRRLVLVGFYISSSQRCFTEVWYQARSKERRKKTVLAHHNEEENAYIFL